MEEQEEFKIINGYENYMIGNHGSVFNIKKQTFCSTSPQNRGYLRVALNKEGKSKGFLVHRLVAEYFCDKKENMNIVHHIDNDVTNNTFTNLIWCNQSYNVKMAYKDGLVKCRKGINNPNYKNGKWIKIF